MTDIVSTPWYKSRTIWVNIGLILAAGVTAFVQGYDWRQSVLAAIGVLGIALRSVTDTALTK